MSPHLHHAVCTILTETLLENNPATRVESGKSVVNLALCFSVREKGAEDCKDLIDAFQACIKTLSEGS